MVYLFLHCSRTKNISLCRKYSLQNPLAEPLQNPLVEPSCRTLLQSPDKWEIGIYFLYGYNVTISIPQYLENLYTIPLYKFSRYCGILIVTLQPYKNISLCRKCRKYSLQSPLVEPSCRALLQSPDKWEIGIYFLYGYNVKINRP